jgi:hypothetical protein
MQSAIVYILLLLFPTPHQASQSVFPVTMFSQIQEMSNYVASTGLVLREESTHVRPPWQIWAHIEAKRRCMSSLYLVHWAYSVYHDGVHFDCRELSRMPAPGAKFLWQAGDEATWNSLYTRWLAQWDGQDFIFAEFMCIDPEIGMNRRAETWLEDADELGFLTLSLGEYLRPLTRHLFRWVCSSCFLLDLKHIELTAPSTVNATERNVQNRIAVD